MSCRFVTIAAITSAFLFGAQAQTPNGNSDRSNEIVNKAISTVKELCLVGLKNEQHDVADVKVTLLKLTPGAANGRDATPKTVVGTIDVNTLQMPDVTDENVRNCIQPYMPVIRDFVLGLPVQSALPTQDPTPVSPSKPRTTARPRLLPKSAADNPPIPSQPLTAKFECYQFYSVKNPDVWRFAEAQFNNNPGILQSAKSSDDLRVQLGDKRRSIAEESGRSAEADAAFSRLNEQDQWRVVLRKSCEMLNRAFPDPREAMQRFRWLAIDIYPHEMKSEPDMKDDFSFRDSAVRMWFLWTAYNNNFFDLTIFEATAFDDKYGSAAEKMQQAVGNVQIPPPRSGNMEAADYIASDAVQAIFKNGPLNDVAAARWMWAKSACALGHNAVTALKKLSHVRSGLAYDTGGFFWRPSDELTSCSN